MNSFRTRSLTSVPGREVVHARAELDPGVPFPKHWHPGEEIIYVLEGSLEYQIEGKPPVTLKGRRGLLHPGRNDPDGEERRQRPWGGTRHVCEEVTQKAPLRFTPVHVGTETHSVASPHT